MTSCTRRWHGRIIPYLSEDTRSCQLPHGKTHAQKLTLSPRDAPASARAHTARADTPRGRPPRVRPVPPGPPAFAGLSLIAPPYATFHDNPDVLNLVWILKFKSSTQSIQNSSDCIILPCGCTLKHGSGNLMDSVSTVDLTVASKLFSTTS